MPVNKTAGIILCIEQGIEGHEFFFHELKYISQSHVKFSYYFLNEHFKCHNI